MEKLKTIKLKGKEYVTVNERLIYFNETHTSGSIRTQIKGTGTNMVTFKAVVTPDVSVPTRKFTGHSFGTIDEVKAFEKLETVAVGRALAFMGIGIVEAIASADEMAGFHKEEDSVWEATSKPESKTHAKTYAPKTPDGIIMEDGNLLCTWKSKAGKQFWGVKNTVGEVVKWLDAETYGELKKIVLAEMPKPVVDDLPF